MIRIALVALLASTSFAQQPAQTTGAPKIGAQAGKISKVDGPVAGATVAIRNGPAVNAGGPGDPIFVGDHVSTSRGQNVLLVLNDQSEIVLGPESDFTVIEPYSEANPTTVASMLYGMLHAAVTKIYNDEHPFIVQTPSSVMGVRGTEFIVEHDQATGESAIHTLEGAVAVGKTRENLRNAATHHVVGAGMMTSMPRGAAMASAPKAFDHQALMNRLAARAPNFTRHVQAAHQNHMQRVQLRNQSLQQPQHLKQPQRSQRPTQKPRIQQKHPMGRPHPAPKKKPGNGKGKKKNHPAK